jgi:hypothetical protein
MVKNLEFLLIIFSVSDDITDELIIAVHADLNSTSVDPQVGKNTVDTTLGQDFTVTGHVSFITPTHLPRIVLTSCLKAIISSGY